MHRRILKGTLTLCLILALAGAACGTSFILESDGWHAPSKDPGATLDYSIDWSQWLAGDTIASNTWTFDTGITGAAESINTANTITTIWLSGGALATTYKITNTITTATGRSQVQSFQIAIKAH
jgi:hypothetical protein